MKYKSLGFVLLLVLILTTLSIGAKTWSADEVPMVHLQDRTKYVCDPENLMTDAMRDTADYYLNKLNTEHGVQTVFVVVPRVKNGDAFRMAQDIGNHYGVGTKAERRGLVIVLAVDDRKYFIAPGKGLEADFTDIETNDIAQACIVANMRVNKLDEAVVQTCKAVYNKLKTGKSGVESVVDYDISDVIGFFVLFVFVIVPILVQLFRNMLAKDKKGRRNRRNRDDDWFPPFFLGGGGSWGGSGGGGFDGGSFGGGSFGGGGSGGGW